jgi:hypothetical protein
VDQAQARRGRLGLPRGQLAVDHLCTVPPHGPAAQESALFGRRVRWSPGARGNIALVVSGSDGATGSGFSASVFADPFFGRVAAGVVNFLRPLGIHPVLMLRPQLTTVRQPIEDMAGEMARLLLSHIEEPDHEPASVIFDPTLVVRASA